MCSRKLKIVEIPSDLDKKATFWILIKSPGMMEDSGPNLRNSHRNAQDCRESTTFTNLPPPLHLSLSQMLPQPETSEGHFFAWSNGFSIVFCSHIWFWKQRFWTLFVYFPCVFHLFLNHAFPLNRVLADCPTFTSNYLFLKCQKHKWNRAECINLTPIGAPANSKSLKFH